jgi:hypothetical protein
LRSKLYESIKLSSRRYNKQKTPCKLKNPEKSVE